MAEWQNRRFVLSSRGKNGDGKSADRREEVATVTKFIDAHPMTLFTADELNKLQNAPPCELGVTHHDILFSENEEETGWKHPMALRYGVSGIPQVILVDKEGKVVSLNARGPELGRLLEKLLGPVPEVGGEEGESEESAG